MARNIRLQDMGSYVERNMEKLLRNAVLETDTQLKQASPVDTGRFRASWQVGENAVSDYDAGPQQAPINSDRSLTDPPAKPMTEIRRFNYGEETLGNIYSVHNNLPYAESLANGSSKQMEAGWVQVAAKNVQSFVQRTADQIARQS
jgi:hypothetical protein